MLGATGSSSGCARRDMFAGAVNMRYSFGCIATESGVLCMLRVVYHVGRQGLLEGMCLLPLSRCGLNRLHAPACQCRSHMLQLLRQNHGVAMVQVLLCLCWGLLVAAPHDRLG